MLDQRQDEYDLAIQVAEVMASIGDYRRHIPNILREAAEYIERKEPMPDFLANYINNMLLSIASGEDANMAIGLKSKKGNKGEQKDYFRDIEIYLKVMEYWWQGYRREKNQNEINAYTKAYDDISEKYEIGGVSSVMAIYGKINKRVKQIKEKTIKKLRIKEN